MDTPEVDPDKIVGVQPMTDPTAQIFKIKVRTVSDIEYLIEHEPPKGIWSKIKKHIERYDRAMQGL